MCFSRTALFYGLFVTTSSLAISALAHEDTRTARHFIDLVCLRRSNGTLKVRKKSSNTIERVPNEIWLHIKAFVVEQAIEMANHRIVTDVRCEECEHDLDCLTMYGTDFPNVWETWENPKGCFMCSDFARRWNTLLAHRQAVESLLVTYGLALPLPASVSDPKLELDLRAATAIALPLSQTPKSKTFPRSLQDVPHGSSNSASNVLTISSDIFNLPPSPNERFRRLMLDWPIAASFKKSNGTVVLPSRAGLDRESSDSRPSQQQPTKKSKSKAPTKGKKVHKKVHVTPQWHLWTVSDPLPRYRWR